MTTKTQDPAAIAATIDVTIEGHNLRAFLLRLLDDGEGHMHPAIAGLSTVAEVNAATVASTEAKRVGLAASGRSGPDITPLGREVAELLRPKPWSISGLRSEWLVDASGLGVAMFDDGELAGRVATLLTRDDERAAKTYKTEGP